MQDNVNNAILIRFSGERDFLNVDYARALARKGEVVQIGDGIYKEVVKVNTAINIEKDNEDYLGGIGFGD